MSDRMTYPNESDEYRAARDALINEERALRRQAEKVAAMRRALPRGGEVTADYRFTDAGREERTLADLFGEHDTLFVYGFMFGPDKERPCPLCTCYLDCLDGAVPHLEQRVATAVIAKSPIEKITAFRDERGWRHHKVFSSHGTTYQRDYLAEAPSGGQTPMVNVFVKDGDRVVHTWGTELLYAEQDSGEDARHLDIGWPVYAVFDMLPEGRGDFYPRLEY